MPETTSIVISRLPDAELFQKLARRHGHFCPMSTLGLRIGWAARRLVQGTLRDAVYCMKTCALDGIQLALDLKDLPLRESAQHRFILHDDGGWLQLALRAEALQLAASYRQLADPVMQDALLQQLRTLDEDQLLNVTRSQTPP
ncbi:MAG: hypothetical protein GW861_01875 [Deltaproteobacteria bacterium]|nr:hypothetical protein [Deltaproteobacteria bacterium]